jgi:Mn2+/Fe2+ NRAMP family transporter
VEEAHLHHRGPLRLHPRTAPHQLARIGWDTAVGIGFSNLVAISIIIATAVTLHAHGITDITTSSQAAEALRPLAGDHAFALFAAGIIGTGLLAVPVLAGSAAYAVAETQSWTASLEKPPREAPAFYTVLGVATLAGLAFNFSSLDPIKALYWTAVVNGALSAPLIVMIVLIAGNRRIMGALRAPGWMLAIAALAALAMAAATISFLIY